MVSVEDGGGDSFKIGLNSGIEFGLLYDPNSKRDEALVRITIMKYVHVIRVCFFKCVHGIE